MIPLRVDARLAGPVMPPLPILDGMLGAAVAIRDNLPPPSAYGTAPLPLLAVPLEEREGLRLCTDALWTPEGGGHDTVFINRRFPTPEAQALGVERVRRIDAGTGLSKNYRLPMSTAHALCDQVHWFCIGDPAQVMALLQLIPAIGKKHALGFGRVVEWTVTELRPEQLWEGFPVVRDGAPLRALPLTWPGLREREYQQDYRVMTPPYWERHREIPAAVPL